MPNAILYLNFISKLHICLNVNLPIGLDACPQILWLKSSPAIESNLTHSQLYCFVLMSIKNIALRSNNAL